MKQIQGQINFIADGFGREKCLFDSSFPCTHYYAKKTKDSMQDETDCGDHCCYKCKAGCGYACNASRQLERR